MFIVYGYIYPSIYIVDNTILIFYIVIVPAQKSLVMVGLTGPPRDLFLVGDEEPIGRECDITLSVHTKRMHE